MTENENARESKTRAQELRRNFDSDSFPSSTKSTYLRLYTFAITTRDSTRLERRLRSETVSDNSRKREDKTDKKHQFLRESS